LVAFPWLIWKIAQKEEGLTFKRLSSVFYLRAWRTVRGQRVDCPRGTILQDVLCVRRMFLSAFVSIHLASCSWLEVVLWTVRLGLFGICS
jgi:hypothetical protein